MKRLAYVSTMQIGAGNPNFSKQMMDILNHSRSFNKAQDVTSVLMVSGNHCFQILEGDAQELAQLMYRIGRDQRHENISIILNKSYDERLFPAWGMRLLSQGSSTYQQAVKLISSSCGSDLTTKSDLDKRRLKALFAKGEPLKVKPEAPNLAQVSYQQQRLHLTQWPKPSELPMTSDLISLCTRLKKRDEAFEALISGKVCRSEAELVRNLHALDKLGLLTKTAADEVPKPTAQATPVVGDRFSQILRKFITSARTD